MARMTSYEVEARCGRQPNVKFMAELLQCRIVTVSGVEMCDRTATSVVIEVFRRLGTKRGTRFYADEMRTYKICPICGDQGGPDFCNPVKHAAFYDAFPKGAA